MTDANFIFRSGKHLGKTYVWVEENDPSYISWVLENRPEMLKMVSKKTKPKEVKPQVKVTPLEDHLVALKPNENFLNEGPEPMSIPYIKKMSEMVVTKSFFDLDL